MKTKDVALNALILCPPVVDTAFGTANDYKITPPESFNSNGLCGTVAPVASDVEIRSQSETPKATSTPSQLHTNAEIMPLLEASDAEAHSSSEESKRKCTNSSSRALPLFTVPVSTADRDDRHLVGAQAFICGNPVKTSKD